MSHSCRLRCDLQLPVSRRPSDVTSRASPQTYAPKTDARGFFLRMSHIWTVWSQPAEKSMCGLLVCHLML